MEPIGWKIKKRRDERDMTQQALSVISGVSVPTIRAIEKGSRMGNRTTREALLKALGLPIEQNWAANPHEKERFEMVMQRKVAYFDVRMPAGEWVETQLREFPDGYALIPAELPGDAFCLRIIGDCMEPDFPSGAIVVFVPVRDGESSALQFEDGKPYYFEHSDGKATFKRVFYESADERFRLQPINPKCKSLFVPVQMKARMSRAVKMMRDVT